jgi:tripartite-type tricarboxylate transporter receptor subunit TctC
MTRLQRPITRRRALAATSAALAAPVLARSALAAWPNDKPVKILVPFAPGGPTDVVARVVAQGLTEALGGAAVVVENKAGAGGNIAIGQAARSEGDGYTLLISSSAFLLNPSLYEQVPYDPAKDFKPISLLTTSPNAFIAEPGAGINSIADLIAFAKKDPDKLTYGNPGTGTTPMLAFELLKIRAGIKATPVVFNGAAPLVQAMLSKTIPAGCCALPPAHPHIQTGALKGLAMSSERRWHDLPNVPTMAEVGFSDFVLDTKQLMLAPAATPPEVVARLTKEVVALLQKPAVKETLQKGGHEVLATSAETIAATIAKEVPMWRGVVTSAGVKMK